MYQGANRSTSKSGSRTGNAAGKKRRRRTKKKRNPSPTTWILLAGGTAVVAGGGLAYWGYRRKKKSAQLPPAPTPQPKPGGGGSKRPPGHPPPQGASCQTGAYNTTFWNTRQTILDAFDALGYATPTDRDTMNGLGADGALGGGDDVKNPEVTRFQKDYNKVSKGQKFVPGMGGLDEDGLVGPCTLNGVKLVLDNLGDRTWPEVVQSA